MTRTTTSLARCGDDDLCLECRAGRLCSLDVWLDSLVSLAIAHSSGAVAAFWNSTAPGINVSRRAHGAGRGWLSMCRSAPLLADACCVPAFPGGLRTRGRGWHRCRRGLARRVPRPAGRRDRIVQMARAGRESDLRAALADATAVLATRNSSTDPAFELLVVRAAQLEGRLTRLTDPAHRRARYATA